VSRRLIALLAVAATFVHLTAPGYAGDGLTGDTTTASDDDRTGTIDARVEAYQGGYRGRSTNRCSYTVYIESAYLDRLAHEGPIVKRISGLRSRLYVRTCPGAIEGLVWIAEPLPPDMAALARSALKSKALPTPEVEMAPPPDKGIVKLGEWFWTTTPFDVTDDSYSATAAIAQTNLWATATAVPTGLTFYPGDGNEPVTCDGPGEPWRPEYGDDAPSPSGCMYEYIHSSAIAESGEYFDAALEIVWTVTWTSSTGEGGTLDDLHTVTRFRHTVRELQAIIVGGSND
jgi:hypothetical protein